MATYRLQTPIAEQDIRKLKINDVLFVSGTVVTARDLAHRRALEWAKQGKPLPLSFDGMAVYHCGPVMKKVGEKWTAVAAGPTTSTRMEAYEDEFICRFKPRVIIGKGGMGPRTAQAMEKCGAIYAAFTGGAAVLAAKAIHRVVGVEWLDLGMPEAMWIFEVEQFGPFTVAIDTCARNLFSDVAKQVDSNKNAIYQRLQL